MQPELSIVIVNYNTKDLTVDCLKSIQRESKGVAVEVVVVDNGSKDGSPVKFEALSKDKYWKDKFTLILNTSNLGYGKANNQGIKKSRGEYILLLNNDTLVHKDSLRELIQFAKNNSLAGVVGSRLLNADGTLQMSCFRFPTLKNAILQYWFGKNGYFDKFSPKGDNPIEVDSVVGAAFLITPIARAKVGLLDERYFAYFEDIDYCRQVWKQGLKVYYLPTSIITHYHGSTFKKLAKPEDQWKKLIPSSKIYHGQMMHYVINFVIWSGQKVRKLLS